jgi:hypothetical protein
LIIILRLPVIIVITIAVVLLTPIIIVFAVNYPIMSFVFQLFVGGCGVGRSRYRWEDNIKRDLREI